MGIFLKIGKIWVNAIWVHYWIYENMGRNNMGPNETISEKIAVSEPYENMGSRIWVYFWKLEKYGSMQYGSNFENTKIWVKTIWVHFWRNSSIVAIWKYGFNNMGPFFKIVKNMGLCNMGSFLKIRKYGSKQYGSISENWTHIGLSKYGLKKYLWVQGRSTSEARRAEFTGGWDGWMEYQKCLSNFFILCEYIKHVYTYLYMYSKIVTNILMGSKISCQIGVRGQKFQNYCR